MYAFLTGKGIILSWHINISNTVTGGKVMADFDIAIPAENGASTSITGVKETAASPARAKNDKNYSFEGFLIITVLALALVGAYESLTEIYLPASSILSLVHSYGYLKAYPIIYEPNKGVWHPIGWLGSFMMVVMMLYSVRKRFSFLNSFGSMRHWLSAHMFLGILGPVLVTLHTTFKLHGIIAASFWCMIITTVFGILGRYIYIQIPRSITGAELGVQDIDRLVEGLNAQLARYLNNSNLAHLFNAINSADDRAKSLNPLFALFSMVKTDLANIYKVNRLRRILKSSYNIHRRMREEIVSLLKKKAALIRRKNLLATSHRLLHYWHVFHVPLAIVMFIIMFLHIAVYYVFRVGI